MSGDKWLPAGVRLRNSLPSFQSQNVALDHGVTRHSPWKVSDSFPQPTAPPLRLKLRKNPNSQKSRVINNYAQKGAIRRKVRDDFSFSNVSTKTFSSSSSSSSSLLSSFLVG